MHLLRLVKTLLTCVLITSSFWTAPVLAGSKTNRLDRAQASARAQASEEFRKGEVLFASGEYLKAAAAFERAYRLFPHPSSLANMGFCYDEVGDYERAVSAFRKYMNKPNPKTPHDTAKISKYLENIKSKVGDLAIRCSPINCQVRVDEIPRGVTPVNMIVLAGAHSVTVKAVEGDARRDYTITVPGGAKRELNVDLNALLATPPAGIHSAVEKKPPLFRAPFWIATSATVVGLGAVTVLGVLNYNNRKDFREGGSEDPELKKRGDRLTLGTNLAIGLTAAAATTAIILAIIDLRRNRKLRARDGTHSPEAKQSRRFSAGFNGSSFLLNVRFGFR